MRAILVIFVVFAGTGVMLASWMRPEAPVPVEPVLSVPKPALIRVSNGPADGKAGLPDAADRKAVAKSAPAALPLVTMSGKLEAPVKTVAVLNAAEPAASTEPAAPVIAGGAVEIIAATETSPGRPMLSVTCIAGCGDKNGKAVFQREVSPVEEAAARAAEAAPPADASSRPRRSR